MLLDSIDTWTFEREDEREENHRKSAGRPEGLSISQAWKALEPIGTGFSREVPLVCAGARRRLAENFSHGKRRPQGYLFCRFLFPEKIAISWINPVYISRKPQPASCASGRKKVTAKHFLFFFFLRVCLKTARAYFTMFAVHVIVATDILFQCWQTHFPLHSAKSYRTAIF